MISESSPRCIPVFANGRITSTALTFSPSLSFATLHTVSSHGHGERVSVLTTWVGVTTTPTLLKKASLGNAPASIDNFRWPASSLQINKVHDIANTRTKIIRVRLSENFVDFKFKYFWKMQLITNLF